MAASMIAGPPSEQRPHIERHHSVEPRKDSVVRKLAGWPNLHDLNLCNCPGALVVKYEDLSTDPAAHFPRLFDFIGEPLRPEYLATIHSRSIRRSPFPEIPAAVLETCEALYAEIDRRYRLSVQSRG